MSTRPDLGILIAAGLLIFAGAATAQQPHGRPTASETATIENSGSTNTTGYTVTVSSSGTATVNGTAAQSLSKGVTSKFFSDLKAAGPLSALPPGHGMHSASFGTRIYLTYHGQRSPDMTFSGDARGAALKSDIMEITQALHARNMPRRPVAPPAPGMH